MMPSTKDTIGCATEVKQPPVPKMSRAYMLLLRKYNETWRKIGKLSGWNDFSQLNYDGSRTEIKI